MIVKKRRTHRKTGCVTCKVRKKRCSEDKPSCSDCQRLGFACVYLPEGCSRELANHYKEQVESDLGRRAAAEKAAARESGVLSAVGTAATAATAVVVTAAEVAGQELAATAATISTTSTVVTSAGAPTAPTAADPTADLIIDNVDAGTIIVPEHAYTPTVYLDELLDELCALPSSPHSPSSRSASLRQSPSVHLSQPLHDPLISRLDDTALHLYNYYRDYLAQIISIAPVRQNYYLQIFLPMAHRHEGILYGLLAWSAHHLSIGPARDDAASPARRDPDRWALEQALDESMRGGTPTHLPPSKDSRRECNATSPDVEEEEEQEEEATPPPDPSYAALANRYTLKSLQHLQTGPNNALPATPSTPYLWALAQILVLCGAEICQGDVARWKILLRCGANLIRDNAGDDITAVLEHGAFDSVTKQWLLANFIYHDVMGSETTHFPMWQYARVLQASDVDESHVDPLHGVNRPVFQVLGEVMNLARRVKRDHVTHTHPDFKHVMLLSQQLQAALYAVAPDARDLARYEDVHVHLADDARQLCVTLFSVFRTTALVHLKTAVLRHVKDSYEVQFLVGQLSRDLDHVLGTRLEGGLCFPLFICGINSTDQVQRLDVERKFSDFIKRYKCRNVERARAVMRKVWRIDDDSSSLGSTMRERDWFDVVDEMKWDISFA